MYLQTIIVLGLALLGSIGAEDIQSESGSLSRRSLRVNDMVCFAGNSKSNCRYTYPFNLESYCYQCQFSENIGKTCHGGITEPNGSTTDCNTCQTDPNSNAIGHTTQSSPNQWQYRQGTGLASIAVSASIYCPCHASSSGEQVLICGISPSIPNLQLITDGASAVFTIDSNIIDQQTFTFKCKYGSQCSDPLALDSGMSTSLSFCIKSISAGTISPATFTIPASQITTLSKSSYKYTMPTSFSTSASTGECKVGTITTMIVPNTRLHSSSTQIWPMYPGEVTNANPMLNQFDFRVTDQNGGSQDYGPFYFIILCPNDLIISQIAGTVISFSTFPLGKKSPSEPPIDYVLNNVFESSDDVNCPVTTFIGSSLVFPVSQTGCPTADLSSACLTQQLDARVLGNYTISYSITAQGGTTSQETINVEVACLSDIDDPYKGVLIKLHQDITLEPYLTSDLILDKFKYISGYCLVQHYVLNNDTDESVPDAAMSGIIDLKQTSCTETQLSGPLAVEDCRTVTFKSDQIATHNFWIHVQGEEIKNQISKQVEIKIGCQSKSFSPKALSTLPGGDGIKNNYFVGQPSSSVIYELEEFKMDEPNEYCQIIEYTLNVYNTSSPGISQIKTGCSNEKECRSIIMDTSEEKLYEFEFVVSSQALPQYSFVVTQPLKVNIICGAENQTIAIANLTYIFAQQEEGFQLIEFKNNQSNNLFVSDLISTMPIVRNIYSSSIKACDISRFEIFENNSINKVVWDQNQIMLKNKTNPIKTSLKIDTSSGFNTKIFVYSYVKNLIAPDGLMFKICVCGEESLNSLVPDPIELILYKTQNNIKVLITQQDINGMFEFNKMDAQNECDNNTVDLYTDSLLTQRYLFQEIKKEERMIELLNETVQNVTTQFIQIQTYNNINFTRFFLGRITRGQVQAFVEYKVQIVDKPVEICKRCFEMVNYAPEFKFGLKTAHSWIINEDENKQGLKFFINLPEIIDDREELQKVEVACQSFGGAKWINGIGNVKDKQEQELSYKFDKREIIIEFKSYKELLKANGTHVIIINISDKQKKETEYKISANFFIVKTVPAKIQNETIIIETVRPKSEVQAQIVKLNQFGDMQIKFTKLMNTTNNIQNINKNNFEIILTNKRNLSSSDLKDLMTIYVVPADDWHLNSETFDMKLINFTWQATEYKDSTLKINVAFDFPNYISPLLKQDTLVVKINPKQVFFQQLLPPYAYLHEDSLILKYSIPKQQKDTPTVRNIEENQQYAQQLTMITIVFNLLLNTVMSDSMVYLVSMINAFQFIFHLPLMGVVLPANVMKYFSVMIPIVMFDVLSDIPFLEQFFEESQQIQDSNNIRGQVADLGYDTHNPLLLLKTLTVLQIFYFIRLLVLFGFLYPLKNYGARLKIANCANWYKSLFRQLIFYEILVIYFGSMLEQLIARQLYYDCPKTNPNNNLFNLIVVIYYTFVPFVGLPISFFWMFTKSLRQIRHKKFQKRWRVLTLDLNLKTPFQVTYYLVYCLRRVIFMTYAHFLIDHPILQIVGLNIMNLAVLIYITSIQPFKGRFRNRLELCNDFGQIILTLHLMYFTDWVANPDIQVIFGWEMSSIISLMILANMSLIFKMSFHSLKLIITKHYNYQKQKFKHRLKLIYSNKKKFFNYIKRLREPKVKLKDNRSLIKNKIKDLKAEKTREKNKKSIQKVIKPELKNSKIIKNKTQRLPRVIISNPQSKEFQFDNNMARQKPINEKTLKKKSRKISFISSNTDQKPTGKMILHDYEDYLEEQERKKVNNQKPLLQNDERTFEMESKVLKPPTEVKIVKDIPIAITLDEFDYLKFFGMPSFEKYQTDGEQIQNEKESKEVSLNMGVFKNPKKIIRFGAPSFIIEEY